MSWQQQQHLQQQRGREEDKKHVIIPSRRRRRPISNLQQTIETLFENSHRQQNVCLGLNMNLGLCKMHRITMTKCQTWTFCVINEVGKWQNTRRHLAAHSGPEIVRQKRLVLDLI
jgi:ABC-type thiamine transport system ATPase subunit